MGPERLNMRRPDACSHASFLPDKFHQPTHSLLFPLLDQEKVTPRQLEGFPGHLHTCRSHLSSSKQGLHGRL